VLDALAKELNTTTSYLLDGAEGHQGHEAAMMLAELKAIFSKLPETDQESLLRSARGLLATVARLVSASNSAYMFEREDALKKLRDMLDPGQVQQFCVCMCAACASWCTC
jgi:hypothetical protein